MSPANQIPISTTAVEQFQTIAELDQTAWDRLAPDDVFGSCGWLRTVEETALLRRPVYFVAREAGELVAAAACYRETDGGAGTDRMLFGRFAGLARMLRIGLSPALVCGSPFGLSQHVRVDPDASPEQRERWTMLLVDAMQKLAREQRITLCFRHVVDRGELLAQILQQRGFVHTPDLPTTVMDVRWASFAEYQHDLRQAHPATEKSIRNEINRARKGGIVFRNLDDVTAAAPQLHAILDAHNRRLNGEPFPFSPAFIESLKRNLGDRVVVCAAMDGENPIAVTITMRGGDAMYLSIGGTDNISRARSTLAYFNISYNVTIEGAIAAGVRRIYGGKLLYDVKLRRGFRLLDLCTYFYIPRRWRAALLKPALAVQRARIQRMVGQVRTADTDREAT